jgi:hypothetical protein
LVAAGVVTCQPADAEFPRQKDQEKSGPARFFNRDHVAA